MATAIGVGVSPFLQKPGGGWADAIIALEVDYPATQLTFKFKLPSTKTVTLYWGNGESEAVIGQDAVEITKISLYTEPGLFKFWVGGDVTDLTHIDINSQDFVSGNIDRWAELTNLTFLSAWGTDITVTDVSVFAALTSLTTLQLSMTNTSGNAATLYTLASLTTLWLQITDVSFTGTDAWTNDAADIFFEDCGFTSAEVDNLIEALCTCTNCAIDVSGDNADRTVASNDDLTTLMVNDNTINDIGLYDGNTLGWYVFDDMATITKDDSDFVTEWADKLGGGNDLVPAAGKPLWTANGLLFNGTTDYLSKDFTWDQPAFIYMVSKQVTWTRYDRIFGSYGANISYIWQEAATPGLRAYAGALSPQNDNLAVDTWGIIRVLFNGASSKLQINDTAAATGNFGTNAMNGFTLAARGGGSSPGNIQVKEVILRKVADTAGDEGAIYSYLKNKYGL